MDGLERFYNATDNVAADIDEQLAKIVGNLCQNTLSEDKFKDKMAAYVRSANCPALAVTKVNPLIWDKLSSATRSADIKVVLRLRMTYLGHLRAIARTGMIN